MGPAIGIDLGTTYSRVGVFRDNKIETIANDQGEKMTPSIVAFTDSGPLTGDTAMHQLATNPQTAVFDTKRLIGRRFSDTKVQADMQHWPFKVVERESKPVFEVDWRGETKQFTPEEISSMILSQLRETAETYLGEPVKKAVITVPTYFCNSQRQATQHAGQLAGLDVLGVVSESAAAAVAYGLGNTVKEGHHVLVFDLGGGTLDVSLLEIADGFFEVKYTAGDTHLGGEDFNRRLVNHFVSQFQRKHGKDITTNIRALHRLRTACEQAKRTLSSAPEVTIKLDALLEGINLDTSITRAEFEGLCQDLFRSAMAPVERVLRDAEVDKTSVDEVVLVGGSTRIPQVQKLVSDLFQKEPKRIDNADEAVAYGAAVQAAILSRDKSESCHNALLLGVAPMSLGIETAGGVMTTLIKRNTTIPARKSDMFSIHPDSRGDGLIQVLEGEGTRTQDNNLLGRFELTGIPPGPHGVSQIEVAFELDANGIMTVSAVAEDASALRKIAISSDKGRLPLTKIERTVAKESKEDDATEADRTHAQSGLESFVDSGKSVPTDSKRAISDADKNSGEKRVSANDQFAMEEHEFQQKELDNMTASIGLPSTVSTASSMVE